MRFIVRLLVNALALWLVTLILGLFGSGFVVRPFPPGGTLETVLTFLIVALAFGVVNGIVGSIVRIVAFPLYIITLGLLALVVNALLLLLAAWLTNLLGFGLYIESFWWGVIGALLLGAISWIIGLVLRPLLRRDRKS